jgi:hypothetical protein
MSSRILGSCSMGADATRTCWRWHVPKVIEISIVAPRDSADQCSSRLELRRPRRERRCPRHPHQPSHLLESGALVRVDWKLCRTPTIRVCWKSLVPGAIFTALFLEFSLITVLLLGQSAPSCRLGRVLAPFCMSYCISPISQTFPPFSGWRTCERFQYVIDCRHNTRINLVARRQPIVRREAHSRFPTVIRPRGLERSVRRRQDYLRDPRHRRPCHLLQ